jgi:ATP-dependent helicase HrpB
LTWEVKSALREDLKILVMSATLDADPVANLLADAPILTSAGQSFPVEHRWLERPRPKGQRFEAALADLIARAVSETEGSILAFLPGEGEIRRTHASLAGRLDRSITIHPLFGALDFAAQQAALTPAKGKRKVVLATSIAETSLTIPDVRVVVDGGFSRRARFDPGSGMSRLVTERVTKAEATQRAGRAGRVADGVTYKLWTKGEDGGLHAFPPAEIEAADLTGLALELALWGAADAELAFLTPPPKGALTEARTLLRLLRALDQEDRITPYGKQIARHPLHPRLAHMLEQGGKAAAPLAALLSDRDPLSGSANTDLNLRLEAIADLAKFTRERGLPLRKANLDRISAEAKRLSRNTITADTSYSQAELAAIAFPDRIGLRRKGDTPRYVLSGGKGAILDTADPLASARFLVATDLDGDTREARVRQAIALTEAELRGLYATQIAWHDICTWSKRDRQVLTSQQEQFGVLVLQERRWTEATSAQIAEAMVEGVRDLGLNLSPAAKRFQARACLLEGRGDWPDFSDKALMDTLEDWLVPHLTGIRTAEQWKAFDATEALRSRLTWDQLHELDRLAPAHFETPLGRRVAIDYSDSQPAISVRLQELFGVRVHPTVGQNRTPLKITLLSPAQRPLQITMDLPGFWQTSYADVRKDMRGRYPKHPWPEDPTEADPTLRAKRKGA